MECALRQINPDINVLKLFLDAPIQKYFPSDQLSAQMEHYDYMHQLRLKFDGLSKTPTTIEKTMTRAQLFETNNPLWSIGVTPNAIKVIHATVKKLKDSDKSNLIPKFFEEVVNDNGIIDFSQYNEFRHKNNI